MYVTIAKAAFKGDREIFKKHFAKSMGNEMCEEKVNVVKIAMAKLVAKVPRGYSKSTDKIFDVLQKNCKSGEITQYLGNLGPGEVQNKPLQSRRFIDDALLKETLKADDLSKTLVSINSQTLSTSKLDPN